jgi:hypothetical protein
MMRRSPITSSVIRLRRMPPSPKGEEFIVYLYRMRIHDLINEIHEISTNTPRKAAFDIYNILENNKTLFAPTMEPDTFRQILTAFEKMAYAGASEFNSTGYRDEFQKAYNLLSFYLGKVI